MTDRDIKPGKFDRAEAERLFAERTSPDPIRDLGAWIRGAHTQLGAALAEIDRMRPVVDAAKTWQLAQFDEDYKVQDAANQRLFDLMKDWTP